MEIVESDKHADAPVSVRDLLLALGDPLLTVLSAPAGLDGEVTGLTIADPEEDLAARPGDLVLLVGLRGRAAVPAVRSAARQGAAAVVVKLDPTARAGQGGPADRELRDLREAVAGGRRPTLLVTPESARWEHLASLARSVVELARPEAGPAEAPGDLFALAQTVAAATGGMVTIEDPSSRVLAYAGSGDEVDELRRLSILGRRGPEPYLALLRDWGVYERLRGGEQVVAVAEHPDLGIRRRLAVGIHAGAQYLGTIWIQEGSTPLRPTADRILTGAARVAVLSLIRQRSVASAPTALRDQLLTGLLDGRADAASVALQTGANPTAPTAVVAYTLTTIPFPAAAGTAPPDREPARATRGQAGRGAAERAGGGAVAVSGAETELRLSRLAGLVGVHAAAYRRAALVTVAGTRVYVLLPDLPVGEPQAAVVGLTREIVAAAGPMLGVRVRAGVGRVVAGFGEVAASREEADRVLTAIAQPDLTGHPGQPERPGRGGVPEVATFEDVATRVLVSELVDFLAASPRIRDRRLTKLVDEEERRGTELVASLLAWLDASGDPRAAAGAAQAAGAALGVHPNTVRYRVRRAEEVAGIDLSDPDQRLVAWLQLRLAQRGG
jgi:DNA-binding PucR family transcriptional regulator